MYWGNRKLICRFPTAQGDGALNPRMFNSPLYGITYMWDLQKLTHGNRVEQWLLEAVGRGNWRGTGRRVQTRSCRMSEALEI